MADETLGPETACFKNEEVKVQQILPNLVKNEEVKLAKSTNDKHIRRPFDAVLICALCLTWSLESLF